MFEDRLYDNIMEEMMDGFGSEVRTDEGSLAFNSCAKQAMKLEEVYGDMEDINDNMLPDTQDLEHLIRYAKERGISYTYATAPIVKGVFKQEIEMGATFSCGNYDYTVVEDLGNFEYALACETTGVEANTNFGDLEPVEYMDDFDSGEIMELLQPGEPDEDVEKFREKVFASFQSTNFCGNKSAYRTYVNEYTGVGGCKPKRRKEGGSYIYITVISSDFSVPNDGLIAKLQEDIDPETSHGEGDGYAPICHNVIVLPVKAIVVNVAVNVIWDSGYSSETSRSLIEQAIGGYLLSLRKNWEASDYLTVRIAQIESRIIGIEGVLDVSNTTINGIGENLILSEDEIPIRGDVNV
jgi:uncharacterized phage protein gp47/JayE